MAWFTDPLEHRSRLLAERLNGQAASCSAGMDGLVEFLRVPTPTNAARAHDARALSSKQRQALTDEIRRASLIPFDRDGVLALSTALEKVLALAVRVVDEVLLLGLAPNPIVTQSAELLREAVRAVCLATEQIEHGGRLPRARSRLMVLPADRVSRERRDLTAARILEKAETVPDLLEVIKLLEVQRNLLTATDHAESARRTITEMVSE
jgi:uncharacterized protein Yka (UPF0111/DUF47 family)